MERAIPTRANEAIFAMLIGLNVYQFFILPLVLLPVSPWWLLTLVPIALTNNTLWFLTHEAFHNGLHPNKQANDLMGRVLTVFFGAPYEVVRLGHLMHHRFNGALFDRPDLYDPDKVSTPRAWASYFFNILGGFYIMEIVSGLPFLFGKRAVERGAEVYIGDTEAEQQLRKQFVKQLATDQAVRSVRLQMAGFVLVVGLSAWAYGPWWPVLAGIFAVRAFAISFANNLPHYGTKNHDTKFALSLAQPRWLQLLHLNFYHHRCHHRKPMVCWNALPAFHAEQGDSFDKPFWSAALAQFKGPRPAAPRETA
jgi:fatty acid desaturase